MGLRDRINKLRTRKLREHTITQANTLSTNLSDLMQTKFWLYSPWWETRHNPNNDVINERAPYVFRSVVKKPWDNIAESSRKLYIALINLGVYDRRFLDRADKLHQVVELLSEEVKRASTKKIHEAGQAQIVQHIGELSTICSSIIDELGQGKL